MFGKLATLALLAPAICHADITSDWSAAPMGIIITNVVYDTFGVHVLFETDLEPPYQVGVYRSFEVGLGRLYPLAEMTVDRKAAFVKGDFTDQTTFVEVSVPSLEHKDSGRRLLKDDEVSDALRSLQSRPVEHSSPPRDFWRADINRFPDNVMGTSPTMELVSDYTWSGFVMDNDAVHPIRIRGTRKVPNMVDVQNAKRITYEYWQMKDLPGWPWQLVNVRTNDTTCSSETTETRTSSALYGPLDNHPQARYIRHDTELVPLGTYRAIQCGWKDDDVDMGSLRLPVDSNAKISGPGLGWRLVIDEKTGETLVSRAYSSRPYQSQVVFLPRAFRGLSAHDGFKLSIDVNGIVICIPDNNETIIKSWQEGL